jgi:hypothetical protein
MGSLTRRGHSNDHGLSSRGFPLSSFTREEGVSIGSRRNHDLSETRADRPNDEVRRYVETVRKPIGAVPTRGQPPKSNPRIGGAGSTGRSKSIDACESMSGLVQNCASLQIDFQVVDLVKDPESVGSLTRSTTSNPDS